MRKWLPLFAALCLMTPLVIAQDPVKVDPKHYKVEMENDQVRVLRIKIGPHEKAPSHEHPASVVVWLTDGNGKITAAGAKPEELHTKAGQVQWDPAVKHSGENTSDKGFELIQVELKSKPAAKAEAKGPAKK